VLPSSEPRGHLSMHVALQWGLQRVDGFGEVAGSAGQQQSLVMIFQFLSWAFARSPGPRRRAWERLALGV
jgi:hypothetical protein